MSEQKSKEQERPDGWKRLLIARNDLAESEKYLKSYIAFGDSPTYSEAYGALGLEMAQTMESALLSYGLISYARPFLDSRGGKWKRVPGRFLSGFTSTERQIHDYVLEVRNKIVAHSDFKGVHIEAAQVENDIEILSTRPAPIVMIEGEDDSLSIDSAAERNQILAGNTIVDIRELIQDAVQDAESYPSDFTLILREDRMFEIDTGHCYTLIEMINKVENTIDDELDIS